VSALVAFGTAGMVVAPFDVHAADAAAPGGRLIVTWRDGHGVAGPSTSGEPGGPLGAGGPGASTGPGASAGPGASTGLGTSSGGPSPRSTASRAGSSRRPTVRRSVVVAAAGMAATVAARLRADPDVASVVPDSILRVADWPANGAPNDPFYATYQADLTLIHVPEAWRITTGTARTVVAILDTGYTASHPDLAGVPIVAPYNELTRTTDVTDVSGHGTHVFGTIAAKANNGIGVAGIAPGVSIMPVKVCGDDGNCWNSDVLAGVEYAVAHGASVINLSLGAELSSPGIAAFQSTFDEAAAAGVVVVAAAGNSGDTAIEYPAAFNHVISVAATDSATTNPDAAAPFSTRNAFVDLAAPGVAIASTVPGGTGYAIGSGTSMATPHVTAVAALVRSANPTWTVAQVETALERSAVDLGTAGRDDVFGYGRVDAAGALAGSTAPTPSPSPTPTPTASPSPTPTPSATPGPTPVPTPTPTPDASPGPSPTPTPDPNASAGPTPSADPNASSSPDPNASPGLTPSPSPSPIVTPAPVSPRVTGISPGSASPSVSRSFHPRITFSVPVTGVSIRTVILTDVTRGRRVTARVTYSAATRTATLIPFARLAANHRYRITVTGGVTATVGGRHLAGTWTSTFRSGRR
jgi:subtilisin family serine protease